jgi:Alginate export
MTGSWWAVQFIAAITVLFPLPVQAQNSNSGTSTPTRASIMFNRWEEDWSVLADIRVPREPLDGFKYIPLSAYGPKTYLSFGGDFRERFEANNAANFGVGLNHNQQYVISRTEAHADLRIADQLQVFVQLQSDFAPWKTVLTPVDQDNLDLEQAFALLTEPIGDGTARVRLGRQQFAFEPTAFRVRTRWTERATIMGWCLGRLRDRSLGIHRFVYPSGSGVG